MDTALYTDRVTPQPSFSPSGNAADALIAMLRKNGQDAEWHAAVDAALEAAYVANNKEALAQVVHERRNGLVDHVRLLRQLREDARVVIPTAVIQRDEGNARLDES